VIVRRSKGASGQASLDIPIVSFGRVHAGTEIEMRLIEWCI